MADEEYCRFESFANNGSEGKERDACDGGICNRSIDPFAQLAAKCGRLATHPEEHPGDNDCSGKGGNRFKEQLCRPCETASCGVDEDRCNQREEDGGGDTHPDAHESVGAANLDEVSGKDADDEGGLDPFTESGEKPANERGGRSFHALLLR